MSRLLWKISERLFVIETSSFSEPDSDWGSLLLIARYSFRWDFTFVFLEVELLCFLLCWAWEPPDWCRLRTGAGGEGQLWVGSSLGELRALLEAEIRKLLPDLLGFLFEDSTWKYNVSVRYPIHTIFSCDWQLSLYSGLTKESIIDIRHFLNIILVVDHHCQKRSLFQSRNKKMMKIRH